MARREITQYFDDIDHTPLREEDVVVVRFSVGSQAYVLDLSRDNAERFHQAIAPFIAAARTGTHSADRAHPRDIRAWARSRGIPVAHRGKIPVDIVEAYIESVSAGDSAAAPAPSKRKKS